MIAQAVLADHKYKKSLTHLLEELNISYEFSSNFTNFKIDSLKRKPELFFIHTNSAYTSEVLDLVTDIRSLFGAVATIVILGEEMSHLNMTAFLAEGADQFFSFPFDFTLIEDFLSKRTKVTFYNAFKYRRIPSRSTDIDIKFDVKLSSITEMGIVIISPHLIKNGTFINFNLEQISSSLSYDVQLLTTHSSRIAPNEFEIHTLFFEINNEVKDAITHEIRMG